MKNYENPYYLTAQSQMTSYQKQDVSQQRIGMPQNYFGNDVTSNSYSETKMAQNNKIVGQHQQTVQVQSFQPIIVTPILLQRSQTCQFCNQNVGKIERKKAGCAIWTFSILLCFATGCCCFVPWCIDDCYDKEYICMNCSQVRNYLESPYGC